MDATVYAVPMALPCIAYYACMIQMWKEKDKLMMNFKSPYFTYFNIQIFFQLSNFNNYYYFPRYNFCQSQMLKSFRILCNFIARTLLSLDKFQKFKGYIFHFCQISLFILIAISKAFNYSLFKPFRPYAAKKD